MQIILASGNVIQIFPSIIWDRVDADEAPAVMKAAYVNRDGYEP